jgi:hypothetical protein
MTRAAITSPDFSVRNYLEEYIKNSTALHHTHTHNRLPTYFFSYLPYPEVDYVFKENQCAQPLHKYFRNGRRGQLSTSF